MNSSLNHFSNPYKQTCNYASLVRGLQLDEAKVLGDFVMEIATNFNNGMPWTACFSCRCGKEGFFFNLIASLLKWDFPSFPSTFSFLFYLCSHFLFFFWHTKWPICIDVVLNHYTTWSKMHSVETFIMATTMKIFMGNIMSDSFLPFVTLFVCPITDVMCMLGSWIFMCVSCLSKISDHFYNFFLH